VIVDVPQKWPKITLDQLAFQALQVTCDVPHVGKHAPQLDQPDTVARLVREFAKT